MTSSEVTNNGVVYREGKVSDHPAVAACSPGNWEGTDYLPWFFTVACHTRGFYVFLAEKNSAVVGFTGVYVDEEGGYFVLWGSRTSPAYQRMGINSRLTKYCYAVMKRRFPNITTSLAVTMKGPRPDSVHTKEKNNGVITGSIMTVYLFRFCREKLEHAIEALETDPRNGEIQRLSQSQIDKYLTEIVRLLAKNGKFFLPAYSWIPLKVNEKNVKLASNFSTMNVRFSDQGQSSISSISLVSFIPCPTLLLAEFVFYGENVEDINLHLKKHYRHSINIYTGSQYAQMLVVQTPDTSNTYQIEQKLARYLGSRVKMRDYDPIEGVYQCMNI